MLKLQYYVLFVSGYGLLSELVIGTHFWSNIEIFEVAKITLLLSEVSQAVTRLTVYRLFLHNYGARDIGHDDEWLEIEIFDM